MKGVIFTEFLDMVEQTYGHQFVFQLIQQLDLPSKGVYTSGGTYPHAEFMLLIRQCSKEIGFDYQKLLCEYGRKSFTRFLKLRPEVINECESPLDFIAQVDSLIHADVRKLYPDAELPKFEVIQHDPSRLIIDYHSKRKMQDLALGLMLGCSDYFGKPLFIETAEIERNDLLWTRFELTLELNNHSDEIINHTTSRE